MFSPLADGTARGVDEVFDNFTRLAGRQPATVEDFIGRHAKEFRYSPSTDLGA